MLTNSDKYRVQEVDAVLLNGEGSKFNSINIDEINSTRLSNIKKVTSRTLAMGSVER